MIVLLVMFANIGKEIIILDVERAALVQEVKDAFVERVQQLDDLGVVGKVELGDDVLESFFLEDILLVDEYLLEVDLVNSLVCIVHAKLLEAIVFEYLKAIYIQKLDRPCLPLSLVARVQLPVQLFDEPLKQTLVDGLSHRVSSFGALPMAKRTQNQFPCNSSTMGHECLKEFLPIHAQKVGDTLSYFRVFDLARLIFGIDGKLEINIPQEQHRRDD